LCICLSIPGTFSVLFILFNVLLTVRVLNLLGICFEILCCMLVIFAALGIYVLALFWTVL
jgi:hypothetical protein